MAKGTPVKGGYAGEDQFKDNDKTANKNRKPLSPRALYGHKAHAGPQHIPASEIGNNMADSLWQQELQRDLDGNYPQGPASSKSVSGKLKNVMVHKPGGKKPKRTPPKYGKPKPPIPPLPKPGDPRLREDTKKIPAKKKPKLPATGLARYGTQIR